MKIAKSTLAALVLSTAAIVQSVDVLAGESDAPARIQADTARESDAPILYLRLPTSGKVAFHGVVNFDNAGVGASGVPYPAPNAVGLLVAIAVHGATVQSSKNSQRKAITEAADKILEPYQAVLDTYEHVELMREGASRMAATGSKRLLSATQVPTPDAWLIENTPVFSLTQDQRALVLENSIVIKPSGGGEKKVEYDNKVKVVSHAIATDDPVSYWTAGNGERLKAESAALLAESLDAALDDMRATPSSGETPHKTIRYWEGGIKKVERAQQLGEYCRRTVIRTLRGGLMIVPAEHENSANTTMEDCRREAFPVVMR